MWLAVPGTVMVASTALVSGLIAKTAPMPLGGGTVPVTVLVATSMMPSPPDAPATYAVDPDALNAIPSRELPGAALNVASNASVGRSIRPIDPLSCDAYRTPFDDIATPNALGSGRVFAMFPTGWVVGKTVTPTVACSDPLVIVMVAVPVGPTDVRRPVDDTVTMPVLSEENEIVEFGITWPIASSTWAPSCSCVPVPIVSCVTDGLRVVGTCVTTTGTLVTSAPLLTEMVTPPDGPTDVRSPVADTVAMLVSVDANAIGAPAMGFPMASTTLATSVTVSFWR